MKKLLIILAFLPLTLISWGQTADAEWKGKWGISGADTVLYDTISQSLNTAWVVTNCAHQLDNMDLGYIIADSVTKLNDQPIINIFSCANYADTTFFKMTEHTLDASGFEILKYRLENIWHSNTPVTGQDKIDLYEAFDVPKEAINALYVPAQYANITAAISAAVNGDTIYVCDHVDVAFNYGSKNVHVCGIGNASAIATSTAVFSTGTNTWLTLKNMYIYSETSAPVSLRNTTLDSFRIEKCYLESGSAVVNAIDSRGTADAYLDKVYFGNYFNNYDGVNISINECIFKAQDKSLLLLGTASNVNVSYSSFGKATFTGTINFSSGIDLNVSHSSFIDNTLINQANTGNIDISFEKCDFNLIKSSNAVNISLFTNSDILFDSCTFIFSKVAQSTMISIEDQNSVTMTGCSFPDMIGSALSVDNINTTTISNNQILSDSNVTVAVLNSDLYFSDNMIAADGCCNLQAFNYTKDGITDIRNNTFITKNIYDNISISAFIEIGDENDNTSWGRSDGSVIKGNKFLAPGYWGNSYAAMHAMLIFAQDADISYNYVYGSFIGYVIKHAGEHNYNVNLSYNKAINCAGAFIIKGAPNTYILNNTVIVDDDSVSDPTGLVLIVDDLFIGSYSDSCELINNIFTNNVALGYSVIIIDSLENLSGLTSNNNILYSKNTEDIIKIRATAGNYYYTFSEWQALGYDANSFNTDPLLDANFCPDSNSPANGSGVDVGQDSLIVCGATYPNPEKIAVFAPFDMGANEIPAPPKTINSAVRVIGGGQWIYNETKVGY